MEEPIIITMGDPTGIGPEIIVKAVLTGAVDDVQRPLLVAGDPGVLQRAAGLFGMDAVPLPTGLPGVFSLPLGRRTLTVKALSQLDVDRMVPGQPDHDCGLAMAAYIEWACDQCQTGEGAAMVTAPISKQAIRAAGRPFPGHTEMLADRCGIEKVVMMLAGERLKVCLVTTHLPFREITEVLKTENILATIRIADQALRRFFHLERPRLAVLALNPHGGEGGVFGDEEEKIIRPAIAAARAEGIEASGPHSADAFFHFAVRGACDAVICMYHDQGLIPLKLLHFEDGVNITLGLPIIRTSVDHGTAYDIAGTGQASCASLVAAIRMAAEMAENRGTRKH
jgi:4-hydroxythreonine-4-phosphate dehydrogenase